VDIAAADPRSAIESLIYRIAIGEPWLCA